MLSLPKRKFPKTFKICIIKFHSFFPRIHVVKIYALSRNIANKIKWDNGRKNNFVEPWVVGGRWQVVVGRWQVTSGWLWIGIMNTTTCLLTGKDVPPGGDHGDPDISVHHLLLCY